MFLDQISESDQKDVFRSADIFPSADVFRSLDVFRSADFFLIRVQIISPLSLLYPLSLSRLQTMSWGTLGTVRPFSNFHLDRDLMEVKTALERKGSVFEQ